MAAFEVTTEGRGQIDRNSDARVLSQSTGRHAQTEGARNCPCITRRTGVFEPFLLGSICTHGRVMLQGGS
jgi:hypothetical protein